MDYFSELCGSGTGISTSTPPVITSWIPPRHNTIWPSTVADIVVGMIQDRTIQDLLHANGLVMQMVSWEDTARFKNSCIGPNISDMTLVADNRNMPVIRRPNYSDITCDRNISNFYVTVGNENKSPFSMADTYRRIPLSDYLNNLGTYTNINPIYLDTSTLMAQPDEVILCSSQICLLPLKSNTVEFNTRIYNYQSQADNYQVLIVISSAQGTSCGVVNATDTDIYFNNHGQATRFLAERLQDDRKARKNDTISAMTDDEKERNVLFIYQIPLKTKKPVYYPPAFAYGACMPACAGCAPQPSTRTRGLDDAVIRHGNDLKPFTGLSCLKETLVRDTRYPIRLTLQYYKVTDDAKLTENDINQMAEKLNNIYTGAIAKGSLVTNTTNRTTEPKYPENWVKFDTPLFNGL